MRNLNAVLLGAPPKSGVTDWNVTPTIDVAEKVMNIVGNQNTTYDENTGVLALDVGSLGPVALYEIGIGVAKSNITLADIPVGETVVFGLKMGSGHGPTSITMCGMMLLDGNTTASEAKAIATAFTSGGSLPNPPEPMLFANAISFSGNSSYSVYSRFPTLNNPTPSQISCNDQSNPIRVPPGLNVLMALIVKRTADELYFQLVAESADGTTHQMMPVLKVGDVGIGDPHAVPLTHQIFFAFLAYNTEGTLPAVDVTPLISTNLLSYDVTDTQYSIYDFYGAPAALTNTDWSNTFPFPFTTLRSQSIIHATFPQNTAVNQMYRCVVDGGYVGPTPAPYGQQVGNLQTVRVNNVTLGLENFSVIEDNVSATNRVSPIQASVDQLQLDIASLTQSLSDINADLTAQITAVQSSIGSLGKNIDEVRLYVRGNSSYHDDLAGFGINVFDDIDAAYEHAITLPKVLRKRIVLDDRGFNSGDRSRTMGVVDKIYAFRTNNIIFSTMMQLNGTPNYGNRAIATSGTIYGMELQLAVTCDGLYLDNFEGALAIPAGATEANFGLNVYTQYNQPGGTLRSDALYIGENVLTGAVHLNYFRIDDGGDVRIGPNSYLYFFCNPIQSEMSGFLTFSKAEDAYLDIDGSVTGLTFPTTQRPCQVRTPYGVGVVETFSSMTANTAIFRTGPMTSELINNAIIVRNPEDLGNTVGSICYMSPGMYFIVGDIDIGDVTLRYDSSDEGGLILLGSEGSGIHGNANILESTSSNTTIRTRKVRLLSRNPGYPAVSKVGGILDADESIFAATPPISFGGISGGDVTLTNVRTRGANNAYSEQPMLLSGPSNIKIDGLTAHIQNSSLFQFNLQPLVKIQIGHLDVISANNNFVGLINIGSNWVGNESLMNNNLVIKDYRVILEDGSRGYSLFVSDGVAYDAVDNPGILVDDQRAYWFGRCSGFMNMAQNESRQMNIPSVSRKSRFIDSGIAAPAYTADEARTFDLRMDFTISSTTADTYLVTVTAGGASPYLADSKTVSVAGSGEPMDFSMNTPLTLKHNDGFYITFINQSSGNGVTIDEARVSIKQV